MTYIDKIQRMWARPIDGNCTLVGTESVLAEPGDLNSYSSGTSFKTSPAIGKCLTELITEGRATTVDLVPFRATRFAEGKPWRDEFNYGLETGTISR